MKRFRIAEATRFSNGPRYRLERRVWFIWRPCIGEYKSLDAAFAAAPIGSYVTWRAIR